MNHTTRTIPTLAAVAAALIASTAAAAQGPLTRPERTDYLETSSYEDVMSFLEQVVDGSTLRLTRFGYSMEGRPLPLVVVGRGLSGADPAAVKASGRTRVFIQGNIHGGEVEGKEAMQMLLRSLAAGEHGEWLDDLVLLVAPIYNADGNERVSVLNRSRQAGPLGGVGTRENAQGLDLNRDHMKVESPEARSLVGVFADYDPHLVVDLHTTNGTRHAYHITYSVPMNPATDPALVSWLREDWMPAITEDMREDTGWHSYYYGNAYEPQGGEPGWYTFDHRPRFNNNYVGLRNRLAILSEAYSYASFRDRIMATLAFVESILDYADAHAAEIRAATQRADATAVALRGRELPVRAEVEAGEMIEILMGEAEERVSRYSGRRYLERLDVVNPVRMREYGTFRATETETVPGAYLLPPALTPVADLLRFHGVRTSVLRSDREMAVERFAIDSTRVTPREFQGHREREVFGAWRAARETLPAGTVVVPTDQPLARLVFYLLEPRSDDGFLNWNALDRWLERSPETYPIVRVMGEWGGGEDR